MTLAGWPLAQVLTLLAAGAAVVTALYLLRMRRRQIVVPFAALWEQVTRQSEARRLARRLRRLLSWLVQIAILAALAFALGDPRPSAWMRPPATLALVVDTSASMAGVSEAGTRLEAALARIHAELDALGPADRVVVVGAGPRASVLAPLGTASEVRRRLGPVAPLPGEADLAAALDLARNATHGQPQPRVLVLTDGALDDAALDAVASCAQGPVPCAIHRVTGPAQNVAITAFAARREPQDREHIEVLARVHNLGDTPQEVTLAVTADGVPLGTQRLTIPPHGAVRQVLPQLDATHHRLVATLQPTQSGPLPGLAADDVAYAVVPPLRPYHVVLVSDGTDLFLEAALLTLDEHVRLSAVPPDQATVHHPEISAADLVVVDVGDHPLPDLPDKDLVVFDPWRRDAPAFPIAKGRDLRRPFLTEQDRTHPIMDRVNLADVNLARGTTLRTQPGDRVLVRTLGEPIVVLREGAHSLLAFGFDPRQSDLPLRVAFPLWLANAVTYFEQLRPGFVAQIEVGQPRELTLAEVGLPGDGVTAVEIQDPSGAKRRVPVSRGRLRLAASAPGFHTLRAVDGSLPGTESEIAANLPGARASDLNDRLTGPTAPPWASAAEAGAPPAPFPVADDPLWYTLLLLVAGIVALEWWTYHRRWTV